MIAGQIHRIKRDIDMKSSLLFGLFAIVLLGITSCDETPQKTEKNDINTQKNIDVSTYDKCSQDTDKDDIDLQKMILPETQKNIKFS